MFAYFIGGPEDLTKRVISKDAPRFINFAEMPKVPVTFTPRDNAVNVDVVKHTYHMMGKPTRDTAIYIWDRLL